MSTFIRLLPGAEFGPVGAEQEHAARCLPNAVRSSRLGWWPDRQAATVHGRALVVGVAPYSRDDLRLLDALDEALERAAGDRPCVQVFSVLDCRGNRDADRFIPGLGAFFQTPLVGLWEDGELRAKGWGKRARDLVQEEVRRLTAPADGDADEQLRHPRVLGDRAVAGVRLDPQMPAADAAVPLDQRPGRSDD